MGEIAADMTKVLIRMPRSMHEQLREAATDRELSMNWLILRAVEEFLDRLIPADELSLTRTTPPTPRRDTNG